MQRITARSRGQLVDFALLPIAVSHQAATIQNLNLINYGK